MLTNAFKVELESRWLDGSYLGDPVDEAINFEQHQADSL